ncbi:MAG: hypothetical protein SGPRY_005208, partial [Prymnesium sp.]
MDVQSLVQQVASVYSAESYADACFTRWMLLPLRAAEPRTVQMCALTALEELAHKLVVEPPPPHALAAWRRNSPPSLQLPISCLQDAGDPVLDAYESSLAGGRLARASRCSFLYSLAVHHLSAAAFGGNHEYDDANAKNNNEHMLPTEGRHISDQASGLLRRLMLKLPPFAIADLCLESNLTIVSGGFTSVKLCSARQKVLKRLCEEVPEVKVRLESEAPELLKLINEVAPAAL